MITRSKPADEQQAQEDRLFDKISRELHEEFLLPEDFVLEFLVRDGLQRARITGALESEN